MTVEVYKGRVFQHGHERRALGVFLQDLKGRFDNSDDLYIVVIEIDANGAAVDLLLLSPRTIILADLKELTAAKEEAADNIQIEGLVNGTWKYSVPTQEQKIILGGSANKGKNPYIQLERMRHNFANWLEIKIPIVTGIAWDHKKALDYLKGWVVLSPGFDGNTDSLELPWDEIHYHHDWFRVISLRKLAWEFHCTTDLHFEFTVRQLHALLEHLGAIKVENLGEVLPTYFPNDLPPVAHTYLFSRVNELGNLIGREQEINQIVQWFGDPVISAIAITGMGGVGKTSLLGCLAKQARNIGWQIKYVSCREKELTLETLLAAIASEINDPISGHLIIDKEVNLIDRLDSGLDYLESKKTLIFIDDFQKIANFQEVKKLLLRITPRSSDLKVIFASREYPEVLDDLHPDEIKRVLKLDGLAKEDIPFLFNDQQNKVVNQQNLDWIWERTTGNPYAIGLLKPLIRKYGWDEIPRNFPLYQNDKEYWFKSLIENLDDESQELAFRVSVIRSAISKEIISHLMHDPNKANVLTPELVDKFIIQKDEQSGQYRMHDFIREYLYAQFDPKKRSKAHLDAGNYYKRYGVTTVTEYDMGYAYYEAIYHFDLADQKDETIRLAKLSFQPIYNRGDIDHAKNISSIALKASRSINSPIDICRWLTNMAICEFDRDQIKEAGLHLQQALNQLPKIIPTIKDAQKREILQIKTLILIEKGRLAYYVSDFDGAKESLSEALKIIQENQDDHLLADCLLRISRIERHKGDFQNSKLHLEEAKRIAEKTGEVEFEIQALSHLALIARQEDDVKTAKELLTRAYTLAHSKGDWRGIETNLSLLADLARRENNYESAAEMFTECLDISRRAGNGIAIRINLGQLAECLIRLGKLEEARPLLDEAEVRSINAGDGIGIAWTTYRNGLFLKGSGDRIRGEELIKAAIDKLNEIGSEVYIKDFEKDLGLV